MAVTLEGCVGRKKGRSDCKLTGTFPYSGLDGDCLSEGDMPDPRQSRLYASRCFALAKIARSPKARQVFIEMAETWNRLATEAESAPGISEMKLSGPYDDLPSALKLRLGEYV